MTKTNWRRLRPPAGVPTRPWMRSAPPLAGETGQFGGQLAAEDLGDALADGGGLGFRPGFVAGLRARGATGRGQRVEQRPPLVAHGEAHLGPRQGVPLHHLDRPPQLGLRRLQELAPRRHVEEQRRDLDRGAARPRRRLGRAHPAALDAHPVPLAGALGGGQLDPRHRGDRGQRLAAEAERADPLEVVEAARSCWWRGGRRRGARRRGPSPRRRRRPRSAACRPPRARPATSDAPASSAFSTSSLTTDAGRSTTSPAAIWLTR